jgi:hypothetical protein
MVTYREACGDPYPRSCSGTNRFIADLKDAATKTRQDINATAGKKRATQSAPIVSRFIGLSFAVRGAG